MWNEWLLESPGNEIVFFLGFDLLWFFVFVWCFQSQWLNGARNVNLSDKNHLFSLFYHIYRPTLIIINLDPWHLWKWSMDINKRIQNFGLIIQHIFLVNLEVNQLVQDSWWYLMHWFVSILDWSLIYYTSVCVSTESSLFSGWNLLM